MPRSTVPGKNFPICGVADGNHVEPDGTVSDANGKLVPGACTTLCKSSTDYSLECTFDDAASPAFAALLGCTVPPPSGMHMPFGVSFWCCPCK